MEFSIKLVDHHLNIIINPSTITWSDPPSPAASWLQRIDLHHLQTEQKAQNLHMPHLPVEIRRSNCHHRHWRHHNEVRRGRSLHVPCRSWLGPGWSCTTFNQNCKQWLSNLVPFITIRRLCRDHAGLFKVHQAGRVWFAHRTLAGQPDWFLPRLVSWGCRGNAWLF